MFLIARAWTGCGIYSFGLVFGHNGSPDKFQAQPTIGQALVTCVVQRPPPGACGRLLPVCIFAAVTQGVYKKPVRPARLFFAYVRILLFLLPWTPEPRWSKQGAKEDPTIKESMTSLFGVRRKPRPFQA